MTDGELEPDLQDISSTARPETATEEVHGLELFRRLFQQSPIGVAVVGPGGRPLAVNPALCDLLGREADELRSMPFADFTHPEDVDADVEQYRRLMAAEIQDYSLDKRFLTADGEVIWARLAVAAVHDPQGEVRRAVAFVQDVTEERRFRRELAARHREQAAVARMSRRALEGEDPSELAREAVEEVAAALEAGPVVLLAADREAGLFRPAASAGRSAEADSLRAVPVPGGGTTERALASGDPVEAGRLDPETREALAALAGSEDAVPELVTVRAEGEVRGLLCVFTGGEGDLSRHGQRFLRSMGDLLGQAVRDRRAREALRESERRYRNLFESSRDAVYVTTAEGEIVEMNRAGLEMFGYEEDELLGRNARKLYVDPGDRDRFRAAVREGRGSVKDFEARLRHSDGETLHCLLTSTARTDADGVVIGFQGIIRDVTEQKRMEEELEHRALHDWLTDLPNRALLRDRLEKALARAERHDHGLALFFVDLDGFKRVNDRWSHAAGDEVLLEAARRLDGQFREEDTVARMGGDEFVVLLQDLVEEPGAVERAAERVAEAFEEPFEVGGERVKIDASVGVATHGLEGRVASPDLTDKDELLHAADQAMYRAKEEPGTRWWLAAREEGGGGETKGG